MEKQTSGLLADDPGYRAVQAISGIGPVLAAVIVAEIGDVHRFASPAKLCSWAGLTPRHHASDTKVHRGSITAVRTLRQRLPVLSPAQAIEYVSALLDGDAPARLVAVATEELVEPVNPVLVVETIVSGAAIRAGQRPEG